MSRFDYEECYLKFDGEIFAIAENKKNARVIGETLIKLFDENEQLKSSVKRQQSSNNECSKLIEEQQKENEQLKADNNRLVNETARIIAEHQGRVLDLIDEKINEYIYKEKLYKHKGKDREASVFNLYCLCLNNLKKELQK